jgi:hypothetical protein
MPIRGTHFRRHLALLALPLLAAGATAQAQGGSVLVTSSPFAPSGEGASSAARPAQAYELAGSSVEGSDVLVCIFDRQAKHSEWIPVGGTSGSIKVVSYDPKGDKAVVVIGGETKELGMRTPTVASAPPSTMGPAFAVAAPAPGRAPVLAGAPSTPSSLAREQNEARMLVSDLLEIGVQQRKAYQEAKQRAAAETPAQPSN